MVENLRIGLAYLKRNLLRKLDSSGQVIKKLCNEISKNNKEMRTVLIDRIFLVKLIYTFDVTKYRIK